MVEPAHWARCDPGAHSRAPPASSGTENTTEMMTCPHGRQGGALQHAATSVPHTLALRQRGRGVCDVARCGRWVH